MQYVYEAVGRSGRVVKGTTPAASLDDLQRELAKGGLALINARMDLTAQLGAFFRASQIKRGVMIDLFGYLNGLLAMGMDMNTTWRNLAESIDDPLAREAIVLIRQSIDQGYTLTESMEKTKLFPGLVLGNVRAGEQSGQLERVFAAMEKHYRDEGELVQQVMKATMYPLISLIILFFIGVGLLIGVIPTLKEIFPPNPPLPTKLLLFLSDGVVDFWWAIPLGAIAIVFGWWRLPERAKAKIWESMYRLPVIGTMLKNLALANLFQNMSLMLNAGVSLGQVIDIVLPTISSAAIRRKLLNVKDIISNGGMFADGFQDPFFPSVVPSALRQGETTGTLDTYLQRIASFLRERARARLHTLSTFIEPALLLVGGGMVLLLAVGIFLPIYGQMKSVGKGG